MDTAVVECRYRGRVIGWLVGDRYVKHETILPAGGRMYKWPDGVWYVVH